MQYLSGYYWQEGGSNASSLMLLQACHERNGVPVLLSCVAEGGRVHGEEEICGDSRAGTCTGRVTDVLSEWFYSTGLFLCGSGGSRQWRRAVRNLEGTLRKTLQENPAEAKGSAEGSFRPVAHGDVGRGPLQMGGILCAADRFVQFGRGGQKLCLLNLKGVTPRCSRAGEWRDGAELYLREGSMEGGIGLLLATEGFYGQFPQSVLADCLRVRELKEQESPDRHLRELGELGERRGGRDMGAVLVCVK